jgi:hypothetical protein
MTRFNISAAVSLALLACAACTAAQADTIADWNFGTVATTGSDNTPAATGGAAQANAATTAQALGMTNTYGGTASTNADDITQDTDSTMGNQDVWRVRGSGGNGWNTAAPEYSQGAQFTTSTVGYNDVVLSFNWAATTNAVENMQVQYNTNVNNASGWTNVGSLLSASVANSAKNGSFTTDTINFGALGITSVANDANFGIRLVSAFNPSLAGGTEYSQAGSPSTEYANGQGNWRFADVQIDGTVAPVPLPAAFPLLLSGLGLFGAARGRKSPKA